MRRINTYFAIIMIVLTIWGCSSGNKDGQARNQSGNTGSPRNTGTVPTGEINAVAGITWEVPSTWKVGPTQQMRVATYVVPATEGDSADAECAIFHFPGTGGAKDANLERWEGQFEQPDGRNSADLASISETEVNGMKVTTIELSGTYRVSGGPMMEVHEKRSGYRLMGAIVETPQGPVFFKTVGPEKTVDSAKGHFMEMIKSIRGIS